MTSPRRDWFDVLFYTLFVGATITLPIIILPGVQNIFDWNKLWVFLGSVILMLLVWCVRALVRKEVLWRRSPLDCVLLALGLTGCIATVFSRAPWLSVLGFTHTFVLHLTALLAFLCWVWLGVQVITTPRRWRGLLETLLGVASLIGLVYLVEGVLWTKTMIFGLGIAQPVSQTMSLFAIFMALGGILGLSFFISCDRSWYRRILPILSAVISISVLLRLDFTVAWIVFAVGTGLVLLFGSMRLAGSHILSLTIVFLFFLTGVTFLFLPSPAWLHQPLPAEIALGVTPSIEIVWQTVAARPLTFLFGSGPGTFKYDFSLYRNPAFNVHPVAWTKRFEQPYSSFLGMVAEYGVVGSVIFLLFILLMIGHAVSVWRATRPVFQSGVKDTVPQWLRQTITEGGGVMAGWVAATVGLAMTSFDMTLWWMWWALAVLALVGMSLVATGIVEERRISFVLTPQYALATSFLLVLVGVGVIGLGYMASRWYRAEIVYTQALQTTDVREQEQYLRQAIRNRPHYILYQVALAKHYLERARVLSAAQGGREQSELVEYVKEAVNTAKRATEVAPSSIEAWETLAVMYLNARGFTPDANQWTIATLRRAIELEPSNPLLYWRLGGTYVFDKKYEEAIEVYRQAIALKPDYVAAYVDLALVYESQGDLAGAIAVYEPIFPLIQNEPDILFNLGRLFYNRGEKGDINRAEEVWLRVVALAPNHSNALYSLGLLYEQKGERRRAREYIERVLVLNPDNEDIKKKLREL